MGNLKALIYDPYLDTLGGGERYVLSVALSLSINDYQVTFAWPSKNIFETAADRFGLDVAGFEYNPLAFSLFQSGGSLLKKKKLMEKYDLIFWVSDGSLPFLFAKKNLVHIQVPFNGNLSLESNPILRTVKKQLVDLFIYNSEFTSEIVTKKLGKNKGVVLYPPIDTFPFSKVANKDDFILSVGRFDSPSHSKRQDVLIEAFKLVHTDFPKLRLILAGGVKGEDGNKTVEELKKQALKLPVDFVVNPDFNQMVKLYQKSKLFWHAAGFGVDENKNPELVEHFGMTTVEAMAAGCVPIVINKGGQREIVSQENGYLWDNLEQLADITKNLLNDPSKIKSLSQTARKHAKNFDLKRFQTQLSSLIS